MKLSRESLLMDLKLHTCKVHFVKVNGESREMHCTLRSEYLPKNADVKHLDEMHQKPENQEVIAVWDLQRNGWRSFRVESVEYAEIIDGY